MHNPAYINVLMLFASKYPHIDYCLVLANADLLIKWPVMISLSCLWLNYFVTQTVLHCCLILPVRRRRQEKFTKEKTTISNLIR